MVHLVPKPSSQAPTCTVVIPGFGKPGLQKKSRGSGLQSRESAWWSLLFEGNVLGNEPLAKLLGDLKDVLYDVGVVVDDKLWPLQAPTR